MIPHKEIEIGYAKLHQNSNYFNSSIGTELVFLIEYQSDKISYIKDIIIKIMKNPKYNPLVKVHLYQNEIGKPGTEIYIKNNLINVYDETILKFDVKEQKAQFP